MFVLVCVPHPWNVSKFPWAGTQTVSLPVVSCAPWKAWHAGGAQKYGMDEQTQITGFPRRPLWSLSLGLMACGQATPYRPLLSWKPQPGSPPCSVRHRACHLGKGSLCSGDMHLPPSIPVSNSGREAPLPPSQDRLLVVTFSCIPRAQKASPGHPLSLVMRCHCTRIPSL